MVKRKISRKPHPFLRIGMFSIFAAIVVSLFILFKLYRAIFLPSIEVNNADTAYLYIHTGWEFDDVMRELDSMKVLEDENGFVWLAKKKKYPERIHPGRYRIEKNMTNNQLLNMLRSGTQAPVMVTFNNIRTLDQLAGVLGRQLEPDSAEILSYLRDTAVINEMKFTKESFPAMFIPDSYEFYWNASVKKIVERMHDEYIAFWSKGRIKKAEEMGLTPVQVSTLASIVDQESLHNDENPRIAGVFVNRLNAGIPLQSDPTIIFALNDFTMRRVLNKHKTVDSPYNTYSHRGLPPGPISIPSKSSIDAVLNYEKNSYLYFCAKDDFSGYHNFAKTLSQHNENARSYQKALNRRKIFN
ncbi:MAG: endolytic transglycosylase MltG [Bacteroidales bacterium]|nr:endolytic transglycosylase MltG [Bacteroidales bacterium]